MMKRKYITPEIAVVKLHHGVQLLAGSVEDLANQSIELLDDPAEEITDPEEIW